MSADFFVSFHVISFDIMTLVRGQPSKFNLDLLNAYKPMFAIELSMKRRMSKFWALTFESL